MRSSLKPPCLAILGLSLVFSTLPVPVRAEAAPDAVKRAVLHHVDLVSGDGSCDDPPERVLFLGPLGNPHEAFVADPDARDDDDGDQGDQLGSAPVVIDSDVAQRHDPPGSSGATFFDIVVRGKKTLLAVFSRAGPPANAAPEPPSLRSVAPASPTHGNHRSPHGPASPSRRLTEAEGAPANLDGLPPPAGAADRPRNSLTAEASAAAPPPR